MIQPQPAVAFKFTNTVKIQLPQFSVFNLKCLSVKKGGFPIEIRYLLICCYLIFMR